MLVIGTNLFTDIMTDLCSNIPHYFVDSCSTDEWLKKKNNNK